MKLSARCPSGLTIRFDGDVNDLRVVEDAYSLRRVWFQHAFDAGFTCAQIGEAAGLSAAAVHKIIGTQRKRDLDSSVVPAASDGEDRPDE